MHSVWIVVGRTGEHSNLVTWTVAAYLDKADAESCRKRLNGWCREWDCWAPTFRYGRSKRPPVKPDDDQGFCYDSTTGSEYVVEEVPLRVGVGE